MGSSATQHCPLTWGLSCCGKRNIYDTIPIPFHGLGNPFGRLLNLVLPLILVAGDRLELPTEAYETSEIPFLYPAIDLN